MDKVLFTAVGSHDPIPENLRDGPMLHICRHYMPSKIYIYYTAEMNKVRLSDDRYRDAIKKLYEQYASEVEIFDLPDNDIINVQLFDSFMTPFRGHISDIRAENPDAELLVNISSGTPAMKSALLILSLTLPFKVTAIQVDTPNRSMNDPERISKYDSETHPYFNKDNAPDSENRCHAETYPNISAVFGRESIVGHIKSYDYGAALREAKLLGELISPHALELLNGAINRMRMNIAPLKNVLRENESAAVKILSGDMMEIFEYSLWLRIKYERRDLSDYIRGFTPALFNLSKRYLANSGVDLTPFINTYGKLTRNKLEASADGREYLGKLENQLGRVYNDGYPSSEIFIALINEYSANIQLKEIFGRLREFEKKIRNPVAHDIVFMDEAGVERSTGFALASVKNDYERAVNIVLNINADGWKVYEIMNDIIINEVNGVSG